MDKVILQNFQTKTGFQCKNPNEKTKILDWFQKRK